MPRGHTGKGAGSFWCSADAGRVSAGPQRGLHRPRSTQIDLNPLPVGMKDCINPWVNGAEEFHCRNTGHAILKKES